MEDNSHFKGGNWFYSKSSRKLRKLKLENGVNTVSVFRNMHTIKILPRNFERTSFSEVAILVTSVFC
jgi:hypothetical protein